MGTCKYCGKDAGFLSHSHKECEQKHDQGLNSLDGCLQSYFNFKLIASSLKAKLNEWKSDYFISSDDITTAAVKSIAQFTTKIHWPFSSKEIDLISNFISVIGISYEELNKSGVIDELSKKMIRGFIAEYFTGKKSLQQAIQYCRQVLNVMPLDDQQQYDTYLFMLNQAADNYMKNGSLSASEQQKLDDFSTQLGISLTNLPPKYQNTNLGQVAQMSILNKVQMGQMPSTNIQAPILLGKNESILWCYDNVTMYQEKTQKEFVGGHSGFTFRIIKGINYRVGSFKGRPVEHSYMDNAGTGSLYITNKHIIFHSSVRSVKVPYNKIIGINPYSDGMGIQRDGANAKQLVFQGFDCSFVLNVISLMNS